MQRPVGVTILAVLCFIGAALLVICGLVLLLGGAWLATLRSAHAGAGLPPAAVLLAGMGAVAGIIVLALAALNVVVGIGLLGLKSWARILLIVLIAIGLVLSVLGLFSVLMAFHIGMVIRQLIVIAIDVWILYYLFRPHVKQAFGVS